MDEAPAISPEALLAATGIERILSGDIGKVTIADKHHAEMLPREIRRACAAFAAEDGGPQKFERLKKFDYGQALDQITAAIDDNAAPGSPPSVKPELLEQIADSFRPDEHDLAGGYILNVQRVIPYLFTILPIRTEQLLMRKVNYDPSDTEIARFRRAYDIANGPMVICQDMNNGSLVGDQVGHLEKIYPRFWASLKTQLGTAMADALTRKKSWKLPWRKERIVQTIYGTDIFSPELAKSLQASFIDTGKTNDGPPPAKSTSKIATMVQPQTQATAEGDLRK